MPDGDSDEHWRMVTKRRPMDENCTFGHNAYPLVYSVFWRHTVSHLRNGFFKFSSLTLLNLVLHYTIFRTTYARYLMSPKTYAAYFRTVSIFYSILFL